MISAGVEATGPPTDFDEFTFDAASRLLTAHKGRYSNTVTLAYDDGGRLASESLTAFGQTYTVSAGQAGAAGQANTSGYDAAGRRVSQTFPDGTLLEKTFTARGQLASLSYNGQSLETREYDPGRRLVTQTAVLSGAAAGGSGQNIVTSRTYRDDGLLREQRREQRCQES